MSPITSTKLVVVFNQLHLVLAGYLDFENHHSSARTASNLESVGLKMQMKL